MDYFSKLAIGTMMATALSAPAFASVASWTDWTSSPNSSSVEGNLHVGATSVDVSYSGTSPYYFVQTGTGTNYWTGSAYTLGTISNAPPPSELVALNRGGTVTINFSQAVKDPLIGLVSWNGNTVDFGKPIEIVSYGPGFWGNGTPILNSTGTGFFGSGELHGIIRIPGSYNSIMFTHTSELWHGFTVGVSDVAPVPLPASLLLFGAGLAGLGFLKRKSWR